MLECMYEVCSVVHYMKGIRTYHGNKEFTIHPTKGSFNVIACDHSESLDKVMVEERKKHNEENV